MKVSTSPRVGTANTMRLSLRMMSPSTRGAFLIINYYFMKMIILPSSRKSRVTLFKKVSFAVLIGFISLIGFIGPMTAVGDTNAGVAYLKTQSTTNAWVVMALASAGEHSDVTAFKTVSGDKATDIVAAILALTANGKDPRSYGSVDLVAKLKSFHQNSQLGDATLINDDAFGILALISAGVLPSDTVVADSKAYILSHQNANGGWSWAASGSSDADDTASAMMALLQAGVAKTDLAITKAVDYLKSLQNADGGFPSDPSFDAKTNAPSTAWVISAINALGDDAHSWVKSGHNPVDALLALQAPSGFFRYQPTSEADTFTPTVSAYAVVALEGKYYPVAKVSTSSYPKVSFRIAGKNEDICEGDAFAPNALKLVEIVSETCGFTYHITTTSFGPYLDRIKDDTAAGVMGWLFNVNDLEAQVGAVDYQLKADDRVLWHFNDFNDKLSRLTLGSAAVDAGASIIATVESFDGTTWKALTGASVHFGNSLISTDPSGKAVLTLPEGSYKIYATKEGFVRSERESLIFGGTVAQELDLSATLPGSAGGGGGSSGSGSSSNISFTISTPSNDSKIGFGDVVRGVPMQKNVTIANNGQVNFHIESRVTGDDLFRNYLMLDSAPWRSYDDTINKGANKIVNVALTVPDTYAGGGTKNGKLVFWAIKSN